MKIKRAIIDNFKGIRHLELDFCSPLTGEPRQLTAILGDNGSGKTTVLQALAFAINFAFKESYRERKFNWNGLIFDRISNLGNTHLKLNILANNSSDSKSEELHIELNYDNEYSFFKDVTDAEGNIYECDESDTFPDDIYWFDQNRNIGSFSSEQGFKNQPAIKSWESGVEQLRENLVVWWTMHQSPELFKKKDYILDFEKYFEKIFPGTKIKGIEPGKNYDEKSPKISDFYFILERDGKQFDIAELSSGEQAIFPILFEFVRKDIKNSIILIDELELHLHPPQQQALLAALPKLGPDCQFIITTHSPYLEGVIPAEQVIRLEGGRLCL